MRSIESGTPSPCREWSPALCSAVARTPDASPSRARLSVPSPPQPRMKEHRMSRRGPPADFRLALAFLRASWGGAGPPPVSRPLGVGFGGALGLGAPGPRLGEVRARSRQSACTHPHSPHAPTQPAQKTEKTKHNRPPPYFSPLGFPSRTLTRTHPCPLAALLELDWQAHTGVRSASLSVLPPPPLPWSTACSRRLGSPSCPSHARTRRRFPRHAMTLPDDLRPRRQAR